MQDRPCSPLDEIDVEIIKNNMRTVGMTREEYFDLLKKYDRIGLYQYINNRP